jgi:hypothetical protein
LAWWVLHFPRHDDVRRHFLDSSAANKNGRQQISNTLTFNQVTNNHNLPSLDACFVCVNGSRLTQLCAVEQMSRSEIEKSKSSWRTHGCAKGVSSILEDGLTIS